MAEVLPYVLTPSVIWLIFSTISFVFKHQQLRKSAKMLRQNGVKHALVTKDQILF